MSYRLARWSGGTPVRGEAYPMYTEREGLPHLVTVRRVVYPSADALIQWDRLVDRTPGTDVTQLSAWASIRAEAGYRPLYLLAYRGKTVVGGALLLQRRLMGVLDICYLPYGPIVDAADDSPGSVTRALVDEIVKIARTRVATFVQPPEGGDEISRALLALGFRPSRAGIAPAGSYRLDLTPPLEEIRAGFSKRLKSWTNRWESKGVTVQEGDERDLPLLIELMAHTAVRQGFQPPTLSYVRTLYRTLAENDHSTVFVGEVNGKPVSADLVTMVGGMVRGRLGGFDGSGETGKLSVPAAVRWHIIGWAKQRGYRWLDFGGLPEQMLTDMIDRGIHTSDEWPSAQRSKLSFNGAPFRYPTPVELIRPSLVLASYDVLQRNEHGAKLVAAAKMMLRGQFRTR